MNLDGSDYRVLHVLMGNSPFYESPGLIEPVRWTLYGVEVDGTHRGLLYSLALDGSHFRVLHRFAGDGGGAEPMGRLVLGLDGDLYGTTFDGAKGSGTPTAAAFASSTHSVRFRTMVAAHEPD